MATFLTDELQNNDGYKLLTGLVVPRPIGWIGSRSADGVDNLAPYSFFNAVSGDPPTVVFAPGNGQRRDTRDNVLASKAFTVNVVTMNTVTAMNATAASLPPTESEFDLAGLTAVDADLVNAPRVAECIASLECTVVNHLHIGRAEGGNTLIVGEVVKFHVDDSILDGTRVDQALLGAVGRHVGNWYSSADQLFELQRPD